MSNSSYKFSTTTATSIVVANMVGTGVFTSLGFQLLDIQSAPVILLLWLLGGILALCGALCYAELGAALPRSGGEYNYVGQIYHPGMGFVSGWVSATIGFAAPTALAAMTAGAYVQAVVPSLPGVLIAAALVVISTLVHLFTRQTSARYQVLFTLLKILLIIGFVVAAFALAPAMQPVRWLPEAGDLPILGSGAVAIALIFVNYAYTGWNAATYLAGELRAPQQQLPRVLLTGTALVTLLYVLLHIMFLAVAPMDAMRGQLEIGFVVAEYAFGTGGSQLISVMLGVLLISTISAMTLAGPRALQVIGQDFPMLGFLAQTNGHGIPQVAILFQGALTLVMVLTATFESVLLFAGFALSLNTVLAVAGVVVLRKTRPDLQRPFRMPLYPLPVIVFLTIMLWTLVYVLIQQPLEAGFALILVTVGWLFYLLSRARVGT